jgi:hypothetical protein
LFYNQNSGLAPDLTAPSDFRVGSLVSPGTFSYIEPVEKTEKKEKSVVVTAVSINLRLFS